MQATVVKIAVSEGDLVVAGDLLMILEAMKMEQPVLAAVGGVVEKLFVAVGDSVVSGFTLCSVEPAEDSSQSS